jgi:hypothetical protein
MSNHNCSLHGIMALLMLMAALLITGCKSVAQSTAALRATRETQVTAKLQDTPTDTPTPTATFAETPTVTRTPTLMLKPAAIPTLTPAVHVPIVTAEFRAQAALLGVAMEGYTNRQGLQQALNLSVRFVRRSQPVSWQAVEGVEGQYDWGKLAGLENELAIARAVGIQPILEIQYTPLWAQKVPGWSCGPIRQDKFEAFASFVEQLVQRYGSASPYRVRYWQFGNELDVAPEEIPGDSIFGCWGDLNDPVYGGGYYAEMLKVVYPRIKAADPDARVMLGGLLLECDPYRVDPCTTERRKKSGYFLQGVMDAGGGDYFDMVDVHSYAQLRLDLPAKMHSFYEWSGSLGGTGLPEKVAFVRQVIAQKGYNKPVFVGEVALKCYEPTAACLDASAAFVPRVYAEAYRLGVVGQVYYQLIDNVYYSLMTSDFATRPMYDSYKILSNNLQNSRFVRAVTDYPGVSGSEFNQNSTRLFQIVWSTDGTDQVIPTPIGFVRAADKFGQPIEPVNNRLTIGWSPIYLEVQ